MKKPSSKKAVPKKSATRPVAKKSVAKTRTAVAKPVAKRGAAAKPAPKRGAAAKPAPKRGAAAKPAAKRAAATKRPPPKPAAAKRPARTVDATPWLAFVEKHGVVLASAKGPVPNLATAIAGEPIIGSWWSHPKGHEIFEILSAIDEDVDVRCFKLVDGKVTFVHRRVWPALVRLARDGVLTAAQVESVHQEHTETGEHRSFNVPFPDWVEDDIAKAADALDGAAARAQLGAWLPPVTA